MPWQGHLVVGVPVANEVDVRRIFKQLGGDVDKAECLQDFAVFKDLQFKGRSHNVCIQFAWEQESGGMWPASADDERGTDAAVFFNITGRYSGTVLDEGYKHGAPDPFAIDPQELADILLEVRAWWPEARILLWTRHH